MDLEELIEFAQVLGFRVNNLFERQDGNWQANVFNEDVAHEYGQGDDPGAALTEALRKAGVDL